MAIHKSQILRNSLYELTVLIYTLCLFAIMKRYAAKSWKAFFASLTRIGVFFLLMIYLVKFQVCWMFELFTAKFAAEPSFSLYFGLICSCIFFGGRKNLICIHEVWFIRKHFFWKYSYIVNYTLFVKWPKQSKNSKSATEWACWYLVWSFKKDQLWWCIILSKIKDISTEFVQIRTS